MRASYIGKRFLLRRTVTPSERERLHCGIFKGRTMFNVRPYVPGFNVQPPDEPEVPGFRMNTNGAVRTEGAASGQPPDVRPDSDVPGFRINSTADVPGFRVPVDGSPRPTLVIGGSPAQGYVNVNSPYPYPVDTSAYPDASIVEKIRDPDWVVPRLGAAADGAISTIPGAWNFIRAIGRAAGMGGKEEAHLFDDEMKVAGNLAGKVVGKAVEYPGQATRAVGEVVSELDKDPLFRYLWRVGFLRDTSRASVRSVLVPSL